MCPFDVVRTYLSLLPDASGRCREKERDIDPTLRPLKFMRAITTGKMKRFMLEPKGMNINAILFYILSGIHSLGECI